MKYKIHILFVLLIGSMVFTACSNDDDEQLNYATGNLERLDPVVLVRTPFTAFIAGDPAYTIGYQAFVPADNPTTKVNVYSSFTFAGSDEPSEEVLLFEHTLSKGENEISELVDYEKLKAGIIANGAALPADPVEIPVGSQWDIRLEPVDASGTETFGADGMIIGVASPFAGIYTVIESSYTRIGVPSGDWNGTEQFIGSVDATTFSHNDFFGAFANQGTPGRSFTFTLNADNTIFIEDTETNLIAFGNTMLTCEEDPNDLSNANCDTSNVLIPSADGKHIIKLTYGYFTTGSGAREFYEVLEKKL